MKRVVCAFLALAVSTTLVFVATSSKQSVKSVHAQSGCSDATLTGNFPVVYTGSSAPGHSITGQNIVPNAAVGVFSFDGNGNFAASYTVVTNGKPSSTSVPDTGTYTVNSDCSGTITDSTVGLHFNIESVGGGAEVFGVQTDTGFTSTFDAKKQ